MTILSGQLVTNAQVTPINPVPKKTIRLNEIQLDPQGVDGGTEFIELYNFGDASQDLGGLELLDHNGALLFTLPSSQLAPKGYAVVQLGPVVPDQVDTNGADGYAKFFTGQGALDHLPNKAGGVILSTSTTILDAVFWGTFRPPTGSAYNAAVASSNWPANEYVNISFANGNALQEGESLGRSTDSTDTNGPADWAPAGGANAIGATPGDRNDMFLFSEEQSIHSAQEVVNRALAYISMANGFAMQVLSATHDSVVLIDPDNMSGYEVSAHHAFEVSVLGVPRTFGGELTSEFERVGLPLQTAYTFQVTGTLSDGNGTSLVIDYHYSASGYHEATRSESNDIGLDWIEPGNTYSYAAQIVRGVTQTGQNTWTITDTRSGTDWGSPGTKNATATTSRTRMSDGVYHETALVTRDVMPTPPPFGGSLVIDGSQELQVTLDRVESPDREASITITQFDSQLFDVNHTLIQTSALAEDATVVFDRSSGDQFSGLGTWDMSSSIKFRVGYPTVDPQSTPYERTFTQTLTAEVIAGGEFVEHGLVTTATNGGSDGSFSFYVDAPTAVDGCGCGCAGSACACGSPRQGRSPGERKAGQFILGFGCIVSGLITAPTIVGTVFMESLCLAAITWLT